MSKSSFPQSDDKVTSSAIYTDAPEGQVQDSSYETGRNEPIPVQKDDDPVEDPVNPRDADNDKELGNIRSLITPSVYHSANTNGNSEQDEKEAIKGSNIIKGRTRGAKPLDTYQEKSDASMGLTD